MARWSCASAELLWKSCRPGGADLVTTAHVDVDSDVDGIRRMGWHGPRESDGDGSEHSAGECGTDVVARPTRRSDPPWAWKGNRPVYPFGSRDFSRIYIPPRAQVEDDTSDDDMPIGTSMRRSFSDSHLEKLKEVPRGGTGLRLQRVFSERSIWAVHFRDQLRGLKDSDQDWYTAVRTGTSVMPVFAKQNCIRIVRTASS